MMNKLFLPYKIVKEHFDNNKKTNKKICSTTLSYYFLSIMITIYALSLVINRIQKTPQPGELYSMLLILFAIFCSPCYLLFELISLLMNSGASTQMPRIIYVR